MNDKTELRQNYVSRSKEREKWGFVYYGMSAEDEIGEKANDHTGSRTRVHENYGEVSVQGKARRETITKKA